MLKRTAGALLGSPRAGGSRALRVLRARRLSTIVTGLIGVAALGAGFAPAAAAQVTPPPSTITNFGGNGSTLEIVGFDGTESNVAVVEPGSANSITATLTIPNLANGNIYTAPIGFQEAAEPFEGCPTGSGTGSTDTATSSFTAPETAGIYEVTAFLGPNFTCEQSWHTEPGQTVAVVVVTSFESVCALAESYSTRAGVGADLCDKLAAAQRAVERGNTRAAGNILRAFDSQVSAQDGKSLTSEQAETLTTLVYYLIP